MQELMLIKWKMGFALNSQLRVIFNFEFSNPERVLIDSFYFDPIPESMGYILIGFLYSFCKNWC